MTTQYTPTLKLALPVTGELSGTWGDVVNDNITSMVEQAIAGLSTINTWTTNAHTLTTANGTTSESRCAMLVAATGGGAPTAAAEIICPAAAKLYVLQNNTSYAVTLKTSAGTGVAVAAGDTAFLFCDGTNVNSCVTTIVNGHITGNLTVDGNTTLGNATSDTITATARFASGLIPSADNTYDLGSSANSWKDLYIDGTATIATLNVTTIDTTNLEVTNIKAKDGTAALQIADTTGVVSVTAAPVLTALTASQAVFTNGSKALVSNSITGTGNVVMSTSPTLVTPILGTPQSGTVTNLTGTASININGTVGATTPTTGAFTTVSATGTAATNTTSLSITGTTTGFNRGRIFNTGGDLRFGIDSSVGAEAVAGSAAYSSFIGSFTNTPFYLVSNSAIVGTVSSTGLAITGTLSATGGVTLSGGTANGVAYLDGSKVLTTGSALTFDGTNLKLGTTGSTNRLLIDTAVANGGSIQLPRGSFIGFSNVADNANSEYIYANGGNLELGINGTTVLTLASSLLSVVPGATIQGLTVGRGAGAVATNTAVGASALAANTTGAFNVAVGTQALTTNTSGERNIAIGRQAMYLNTTGGFNVAVGMNALEQNTTALNNTAVGYVAMQINTTGADNSAFGANALNSNTTGSANTSVGRQALQANTTASNNTAVGYQAGYSNTTATDVAALGYRAAYNNTTALGTVAIGAQAGLAVTTGNYNVFVGPFAGQGVGGNITGAGNTAVGPSAGASLTTGSYNSFFGPAGQVNQGPGGLITTGSKNTILGAYNGNQGGLDIRTASNYIVLSDGDGNPRVFHDGSWLYSPNNIAQGNTQNINYGSGLSFGAAGKGLLLQQTVNTDDERVYLTNNAQTSTASGFTGAFAYNKTGAGASAYYQVAGQHLWLSAGTGTAGNTISWTNILSAKKDTTLALQGASLESGTGITFPATQSASSNANTLDDYEEGTFTPTISPEGSAFSTLTYTYREARYTKIGNTVFIDIYITINSVSGGSSNVNITGLPFTVASGSGNAFPLTAWISATNWSTTYDNLVPVALYGGTSIWMTLTSRNNAYGRLQATDLAAGNEWRITGFYNV